MNTKKIVSMTTALAILASVAIAIPALANTTTPAPATQPAGAWQGGQRGGPGGGRMGPNDGKGMTRPAVFGTVTAVNGTSLDINARKGFGTTTTTTAFTVDASNATVKKDNATSTLSSIDVGDTVVVQGTVSGTSVTATAILDGQMMSRPNGTEGRGEMNGATTTSPVVGNGQPVVAGTISALNGSSITITNKSNVQYTIDASNAKIVQGQNTISLSNLSIGTNVLVQGTVNGTSITATTVIDQAQPAGSATTTPNNGQPHSGFLGGIGQFFMHLFGF